MATSTEIKNFIKQFGTLAVAECNRRIAAGEPFILPSVCMAQAAIETGWGTAGLMTRANAYFGIKAGGSWTGAVYRADTWEVANGVSYNTTANFRAYNSPAESIVDYYKLITGLSRYSKALSYGKDRSQWLTPKATITAIWAGGYATDTLYVEKIMNIVNGRNLTSYDALITGEGDFATPANDFSINLSDLVTGALYVSDSGRSISLDSTVTTSKALPWDKAFTVDSDTVYNLNAPFLLIDGENAFNIVVFTLIGDDAKSIGTYSNGQEIAIVAGSKVGFNIVPAPDSVYSINDLPTSGELELNNNLPAGAEVSTSVIAYFVKVE